MILHRREPRDDPDDERPLRHAELVEHPPALGHLKRNERLLVQEVGDRHDARRADASLRLHEPRDARAVSDDPMREAIRDAVRPQNAALQVGRVPRPAARDHAANAGQAGAQRSVHARVRIVAVHDVRVLRAKEPDQAYGLLHRVGTQEALHWKSVHRNSGILVSRHQRSVVPDAHHRDRETPPVQPFCRSQCVQLGAPHLHVVDAIHDPDRVSGRSDGQACLADATLLRDGRLTGASAPDG